MLPRTITSCDGWLSLRALLQTSSWLRPRPSGSPDSTLSGQGTGNQRLGWVPSCSPGFLILTAPGSQVAQSTFGALHSGLHPFVNQYFWGACNIQIITSCPQGRRQGSKNCIIKVIKAYLEYFLAMHFPVSQSSSVSGICNFFP